MLDILTTALELIAAALVSAAAGLAAAGLDRPAAGLAAAGLALLVESAVFERFAQHRYRVGDDE